MNDVSPIIYTPDNEPYLGRELLYHFDQIICSAMEQNTKTAPTTHGASLNDHQIMACQVVAQSLSIVLSIRELIRQGYLFGAHVLVRSLVERATILLYTHTIIPTKLKNGIKAGNIIVHHHWLRCLRQFKNTMAEKSLLKVMN